ncbi:MAG: phage tail protein I [Cetobacterium sp.]
MIDIYDIKSNNLAPSSKLRNDEDLLFFRVVDKAIKKFILDEIEKLILLDNVDNLPEQMVDLLADELHVDFYDYSAIIKEKRHLVKTSILSHMKKGTLFPVQNILDTFFQESIIKEWFEYGGEPGKFKVEISDSEADYTQTNRIIKMIDSVKRTSQHLENLIFIKGDNSILNHYGAVYDSGRKIDKYNPI